MNERGSQVSEQDYQDQFRIDRRSIADASVTDLKNKLEMQQMQTDNELQYMMDTQRGIIRSQLSTNTNRNMSSSVPRTQEDFDQNPNNISIEEQRLLAKLQKLKKRK